MLPPPGGAEGNRHAKCAATATIQVYKVSSDRRNLIPPKKGEGGGASQVCFEMLCNILCFA